MIKRQNVRLEAFLSLNWYEMALRFLFTFVAKTSEILLAAGLVVSTANFLTDGSILATHPDISAAWAWAQALAIDSSLGVSLSYAFQCFKEEEWIRGLLYGLLTLLLAGVAGAITTIDIVSHALHLSTSAAMVQMAINVALLSRLRAIAVIGFILMSRLRDLPFTALLTKPAPEPQPLSPENGPSQETRIRAAIQSLCSQFNAEEVAQVINACIAAKKIVLAQAALKNIAESHQPPMDQQRQNQPSEHAPDPTGTGVAQGEPDPPVVPPLLSRPKPISLLDPSRKAPVATVPPASVEHHPWKEPGPSSQGLRVPAPIAEGPSREPALEQGTAREPQGGAAAQSEPDGVPPQERLEQAYHLLIAEGKRPSGRALAERAHVHRSTCVEWLRMRQRQATENEPILEEPVRDEPLVPDEPFHAAAMERPGKAPECESASASADPPDTALRDLPEVEVDLHVVAGDVPPDVFPDSLLPEDRSDV